MTYRRSSRGASMPTVMMMVALMMTLAFMVLAIAFNHLNVSFRSGNSSQSRHLAEAVLSLAIEKLSADEEFGLIGNADDKTIQLTFDSLPDGSLGVLSFDTGRAASLGVPHSTNNRSETSTVGANGQVVPGQAIHLVAVAEVKGSRTVVETVVVVPRFPYSIASNGQIESTGGLTVASVRPGVNYDLALPLHEDDLEPGHLVTNSTSGNDAVVLSGTNKIFGDLQSASGATLGPDTQILGEERLNTDPITLPDLSIWDYDPIAEPGVQNVFSGGGTLSVSGFNRASSDITIDNGIVLDGGVLFVDGDLNVSAGGVTGKGALIASGNININGGGEASTDNQAALISGGDITLRGITSEKAKFAGLVYTEGNLSAENFRLAGVFVAAGNSSDVLLKDSELYHVDEHAFIDLTKTTTFNVPNVPPPTLTFNGEAISASYDYSQLNANISSYLNPASGGNEPEYLFKAELASSSTGYVTFEVGPSGPAMVETSGPDQYLIDGQDLGMEIFGTPVTSGAHAESVVITHFENLYASTGQTLSPSDRATLANMAHSLFTSSGASFNLAYQAAQQTYDNNQPGGGGSTTFNWSLDLSDFISRSQRMRVLYWAAQS